jgi:hypothetical protein
MCFRTLFGEIGLPDHVAKTSGAIFTDILEFRARVLVISGDTGGYGRAVLSPDTALPALLR